MKNRVGLIACFVIYFLILKYMLSVFIPFILALLLFFLLKPIIDYCELLFHMRRNAIGMSLLLIIYLLVAFILVMSILYLLIYCFQIVKNIPDIYQNMINPFFENILFWVEKQFPFLMNQDCLNMIKQYSGQYLMQFLSMISYIITMIPHFLFSFFLFIISTFFLVLEYDEIKVFVICLCSSKYIHFINKMKELCIKSIGIFFKCQMILMFVSFLILWICFTILKIDHSLLYAFLTCLLDGLPFIGVGIVLIPMFIFYLLQNTFLNAFYIFLIYLMINLIRSFLEPYIMNKQMKVPSFILLLSLMIHLYLFGIIGVILSPIHMNILYSYIEYSFH